MTLNERIKSIGIIPVIKIPSVGHAVPLARTLREAGINQIEVTLRNECALDCIRAIRKEFPDMIICAGTVLSEELVVAAKEAGADMCVAPGTNEKVIRKCQELDLPILPGIATPTEIEKVLGLGITTMKFFPAELSGGVKTIGQFAGPYAQAEYIPTSGISFDNLASYLSNKKVAAVGGSFMAPAAKVLAEDWDGIRALCEKAIAIAQDARAGKKEAKPVAEPVAEKKAAVKGGKVVGFGDFMVRLSPPGYLKFIQADSFDTNYTGAEANVLVSLSCMDEETDFVTRLPENPIADAGIAMMKKYGVGTKHILRGGDRIGVFYLEKGAAQRPSRCVYDRANSGIALAKPGMFDWDAIFEGASVFHVTGITPALGPDMPATTLEAVKKAKEHGLTVSCDLNYRKNLWTSEEAGKCMREVLKYVDILIANEEDCDKVLGIRAANTDVTKGQINKEGYIDVAEQLVKEFGVKEVGITLRESISASDNKWGAMIYTNGQAYYSRTYNVHIVDRVGGGDSFAAGLIYGTLHDFDPQRKIEYAAAASCLKHSIELDFNLSSVSEIELLAGGDASGRVQR